MAIAHGGQKISKDSLPSMIAAATCRSPTFNETPGAGAAGCP